MTRILLLLPTRTYKATEFLDAARALGVEVVVASDRRQALADESGGTTLQVDFRGTDVSREIQAAHRTGPFAAVLGVDDDSTVAAAHIARGLGLRHNDPAAVARAGHKGDLRAAQHAAGLPAPSYVIHDSRLDPAPLSAAQRYPCVLKPTSMSGSRGVIRANDQAEFVDAFVRIGAILNEDDAGPHEILVEDFLAGSEVALEGILDDGRLVPLACFDKPDPLNGPFFAETLYIAPARITAPALDRVVDAVGRTADALGLRHGPIHAEVRVQPDGRAVVLELAPRTIGGRCGRALEFDDRRSLAEVVLRHQLGEALPEPIRKPVGVLMLPVEQTGTLRCVGGIDEARQVEGIVGVDITIGRGQEVRPLPEGDRYLGFVYARGRSTDAVEAALRTAWARLDVAIDPGTTKPQPLAEL